MFETTNTKTTDQCILQKPRKLGPTNKSTFTVWLKQIPMGPNFFPEQIGVCIRKVNIYRFQT